MQTQHEKDTHPKTSYCLLLLSLKEYIEICLLPQFVHKFEDDM